MVKRLVAMRLSNKVIKMVETVAKATNKSKTAIFEFCAIHTLSQDHKYSMLIEERKELIIRVNEITNRLKDLEEQQTRTNNKEMSKELDIEMI